METKGAITLYQAIKDFQHITGRGDKDYYRLFNMAVMCLRDLNMFATNRLKTYKVNTSEISNDLGIIEYPSDAIGIYGVFTNYNGTLYPLVSKENMIYTDTYMTQNEDIGEGVVLDSTADRGFATRGAKSDYYYYDDTNERRIVINGTGDVQLWIQYVASGVDENSGEETVIPVYLEEAIHNYLLWKESLMHVRGNKNLAQTYFYEYKKSKNKIKTFEMPSIDELRDCLYQSWRRTPKR